MKKSILTLGKTLNKAEQKEVNGGVSGKRCCEWRDGHCTDWAEVGVTCPFSM